MGFRNLQEKLEKLRIIGFLEIVVCSIIGSKSRSISKYQMLRFWLTEKQKIIDYIFQQTSLEFLEMDAAISKVIKI